MSVSRHLPSPGDPELSNITEFLIDSSSLQRQSSCIFMETPSKYRFKQVNGH